MREETPPVIAGQKVRLLEQLETIGGKAHGAAHKKRTQSVRRKDDRDERKDGIVDESSGVDRYFIEAKDKGERRRDDQIMSSHKSWFAGREIFKGELEIDDDGSGRNGCINPEARTP